MRSELRSSAVGAALGGIAFLGLGVYMNRSIGAAPFGHPGPLAFAVVVGATIGGLVAPLFRRRRASGDEKLRGRGGGGEMRIRALEPGDWQRVSEIYAEGIAARNATFETEVPTWEAWDRSHLTTCRFVAELDETVLGWAALSPVSDRCAYGGVAEVSVYVASASRGSGIGSALLERLVTASEAAGLWTLQAGLFSENEGSLRLHERAGFRVVGRRERLGKLDGRWRDVLLLERRSARAGVD